MKGNTLLLQCFGTDVWATEKKKKKNRRIFISPIAKTLLE